MNSYILGLIVIGGSTVGAVLGLLLVRKCVNKSVLKQHHEVGGYMLAILGTLYAVVLGFVVVNASDAVHDAKINVSTEANSLLDIYRFSDGLPPANHEEIRLACLEYADAVADEEWNLMPKGIMCIRAFKGLNNIWGSIKHFDPVTEQQKTFYGAIITSFSSLSDGRRMRLVTAVGHISVILWVVLVVGGISVIGFTYFFSMEKLASQALMTALVALCLSLNLYLVIVNSSPYTGNFRIGPTAFRLAAKVLRLNGHLPEKNIDLKEDITLWR